MRHPAWFFNIVLLTMIALGVSIWQFYSLTSGNSLSDGYTAGRHERSIDQVTPAVRPLPG